MAPWKKNHESVYSLTLGIITQFPKVTPLLINVLMERGPFFLLKKSRLASLTNPDIALSGG
jgi:hypothetical protein